MEGFEIENMDLIKVDVETLTLRDKVDTVFMVNIYYIYNINITEINLY